MTTTARSGTTTRKNGSATVQPAMPPTTRRSTLQQERSREVRRKLAHAANQLWGAQGFDETSVSEICDLAGVPRPNFYFYFQSKEDLLFELGLEAIEGVAAAAVEAAELSSTDEALRSVVRAFARQAKRTPKPLLDRTIIELMSRQERWSETRGDGPTFYQFLIDLVSQARERGEISDEYGTGEVAQTLGAALREGLLLWARNPVKVKLEDLLYRRLRMILNGAAVPLNAADDS